MVRLSSSFRAGSQVGGPSLQTCRWNNRGKNNCRESCFLALAFPYPRQQQGQPLHWASSAGKLCSPAKRTKVSVCPSPPVLQRGRGDTLTLKPNWQKTLCRGDRIDLERLRAFASPVGVDEKHCEEKRRAATSGDCHGQSHVADLHRTLHSHRVKHKPNGQRSSGMKKKRLDQGLEVTLKARGKSG